MENVIVMNPGGKLNDSHLQLFHLRRIGPPATCDGVMDVMDLGKVTSMFGRNKQQVDFLLDSSNNVASQYISRLHARIVRQENNSHRLFDDSLNGIFINNTKIQGSVVLREGDIITFGHPFGLRLATGVWKRQPDSEYQFIFESCSCSAQNSDSRADKMSLPPAVVTDSLKKSSNKFERETGTVGKKSKMVTSKRSDSEATAYQNSVDRESMQLQDTFVSDVSFQETLSSEKKEKVFASCPLSPIKSLAQTQCLTSEKTTLSPEIPSDNISYSNKSNSPQKNSAPLSLQLPASTNWQPHISPTNHIHVNVTDDMFRRPQTPPQQEKKQILSSSSHNKENEVLDENQKDIENVKTVSLEFPDFEDSEPGFSLQDIAGEFVLTSVLKLCPESSCTDKESCEEEKESTKSLNQDNMSDLTVAEVSATPASTQMIPTRSIVSKINEKSLGQDGDHNVENMTDAMIGIDFNVNKTQVSCNDLADASTPIAIVCFPDSPSEHMKDTTNSVLIHSAEPVTEPVTDTLSTKALSAESVTEPLKDMQSLVVHSAEPARQCTKDDLNIMGHTVKPDAELANDALRTTEQPTEAITGPMKETPDRSTRSSEPETETMEMADKQSTNVTSLKTETKLSRFPEPSTEPSEELPFFHSPEPMDVQMPFFHSPEHTTGSENDAPMPLFHSPEPAAATSCLDVAPISLFHSAQPQTEDSDNVPDDTVEHSVELTALPSDSAPTAVIHSPKPATSATRNAPDADTASSEPDPVSIENTSDENVVTTRNQKSPVYFPDEKYNTPKQEIELIQADDVSNVDTFSHEPEVIYVDETSNVGTFFGEPEVIIVDDYSEPEVIIVDSASNVDSLSTFRNTCVESDANVDKVSFEWEMFDPENLRSEHARTVLNEAATISENNMQAGLEKDASHKNLPYETVSNEDGTPTEDVKFPEHQTSLSPENNPTKDVKFQVHHTSTEENIPTGDVKFVEHQTSPEENIPTVDLKFVKHQTSPEENIPIGDVKFVEHQTSPEENIPTGDVKFVEHQTSPEENIPTGDVKFVEQQTSPEKSILTEDVTFLEHQTSPRNNPTEDIKFQVHQTSPEENIPTEDVKFQVHQTSPKEKIPTQDIKFQVHQTSPEENTPTEDVKFSEYQTSPENNATEDVKFQVHQTSPEENISTEDAKCLGYQISQEESTITENVKYPEQQTSPEESTLTKDFMSESFPEKGSSNLDMSVNSHASEESTSIEGVMSLEHQTILEEMTSTEDVTSSKELANLDECAPNKDLTAMSPENHILPERDTANVDIITLPHQTSEGNTPIEDMPSERQTTPEGHSTTQDQEMNMFLENQMIHEKQTSNEGVKSLRNQTISSTETKENVMSQEIQTEHSPNRDVMSSENQTAPEVGTRDDFATYLECQTVPEECRSKEEFMPVEHQINLTSVSSDEAVMLMKNQMVLEEVTPNDAEISLENQIIPVKNTSQDERRPLEHEKISEKHSRNEEIMSLENETTPEEDIQNANVNFLEDQIIPEECSPAQTENITPGEYQIVSEQSNSTKEVVMIVENLTNSEGVSSYKDVMSLEKQQMMDVNSLNDDVMSKTDHAPGDKSTLEKAMISPLEDHTNILDGATNEVIRSFDTLISPEEKTPRENGMSPEVKMIPIEVKEGTSNKDMLTLLDNQVIHEKITQNENSMSSEHQTVLEKITPREDVMAVENQMISVEEDNAQNKDSAPVDLQSNAALEHRTLHEEEKKNDDLMLKENQRNLEENATNASQENQNIHKKQSTDLFLETETSTDEGLTISENKMFSTNASHENMKIHEEHSLNDVFLETETCGCTEGLTPLGNQTFSTDIIPTEDTSAKSQTILEGAQNHELSRGIETVPKMGETHEVDMRSSLSVSHPERKNCLNKKSSIVLLGDGEDVFVSMESTTAASCSDDETQTAFKESHHDVNKDIRVSSCDETSRPSTMSSLESHHLSECGGKSENFSSTFTTFSARGEAKEVRWLYEDGLTFSTDSIAAVSKKAFGSISKEKLEGTDFVTSTPIEGGHFADNALKGRSFTDTFLSPVSEASVDQTLVDNNTHDSINCSTDSSSSLNETDGGDLLESVKNWKEEDADNNKKFDVTIQGDADGNGTEEIVVFGNHADGNGTEEIVVFGNHVDGNGTEEIAGLGNHDADGNGTEEIVGLDNHADGNGTEEIVGFDNHNADGNGTEEIVGLANHNADGNRTEEIVGFDNHNADGNGTEENVGFGNHNDDGNGTEEVVGLDNHADENGTEEIIGLDNHADGNGTEEIVGLGNHNADGNGTEEIVGLDNHADGNGTEDIVGLGNHNADGNGIEKIVGLENHADGNGTEEIVGFGNHNADGNGIEKIVGLENHADGNGTEEIVGFGNHNADGNGTEEIVGTDSHESQANDETVAENNLNSKETCMLSEGFVTTKCDAVMIKEVLPRDGKETTCHFIEKVVKDDVMLESLDGKKQHDITADEHWEERSEKTSSAGDKESRIEDVVSSVSVLEENDEKCAESSVEKIDEIKLRTKTCSSNTNSGIKECRKSNGDENVIVRKEIDTSDFNEDTTKRTSMEESNEGIIMINFSVEEKRDENEVYTEETEEYRTAALILEENNINRKPTEGFGVASNTFNRRKSVDAEDLAEVGSTEFVSTHQDQPCHLNSDSCSQSKPVLLSVDKGEEETAGIMSGTSADLENERNCEETMEEIGQNFDTQRENRLDQELNEQRSLLHHSNDTATSKCNDRQARDSIVREHSEKETFLSKINLKSLTNTFESLQSSEHDNEYRSDFQDSKKVFSGSSDQLNLYDENHKLGSEDVVNKLESLEKQAETSSSDEITSSKLPPPPEVSQSEITSSKLPPPTPEVSLSEITSSKLPSLQPEVSLSEITSSKLPPPEISQPDVQQDSEESNENTEYEVTVKVTGCNSEQSSALLNKPLLPQDCFLVPQSQQVTNSPITSSRLDAKSKEVRDGDKAIDEADDAEESVSSEEPGCKVINSSSSSFSSITDFKDEEDLHLFWSQASSSDVSTESDSHVTGTSHVCVAGMDCPVPQCDQHDSLNTQNSEIGNSNNSKSKMNAEQVNHKQDVDTFFRRPQRLYVYSAKEGWVCSAKSEESEDISDETEQMAVDHEKAVAETERKTGLADNFSTVEGKSVLADNLSTVEGKVDLENDMSAVQKEKTNDLILVNETESSETSMDEGSNPKNLLTMIEETNSFDVVPTSEQEADFDFPTNIQEKHINDDFLPSKKATHVDTYVDDANRSLNSTSDVPTGVNTTDLNMPTADVESASDTDVSCPEKETNLEVSTADEERTSDTDVPCSEKETNLEVPTADERTSDTETNLKVRTSDEENASDTDVPCPEKDTNLKVPTSDEESLESTSDTDVPCPEKEANLEVSTADEERTSEYSDTDVPCPEKETNLEVSTADEERTSDTDVPCPEKETNLEVSTADDERTSDTDLPCPEKDTDLKVSTADEERTSDTDMPYPEKDTNLKVPTSDEESASDTDVPCPEKEANLEVSTADEERTSDTDVPCSEKETNLEVPTADERTSDTDLPCLAKETNLKVRTSDEENASDTDVPCPEKDTNLKVPTSDEESLESTSDTDAPCPKKEANLEVSTADEERTSEYSDTDVPCPEKDTNLEVSTADEERTSDTDVPCPEKETNLEVSTADEERTSDTDLPCPEEDIDLEVSTADEERTSDTDIPCPEKDTNLEVSTADEQRTSDTDVPCPEKETNLEVSTADEERTSDTDVPCSEKETNLKGPTADEERISNTDVPCPEKNTSLNVPTSEERTSDTDVLCSEKETNLKVPTADEESASDTDVPCLAKETNLTVPTSDEESASDTDVPCLAKDTNLKESTADEEQASDTDVPCTEKETSLENMPTANEDRASDNLLTKVADGNIEQGETKHSQKLSSVVDVSLSSPLPPSSSAPPSSSPSPSSSSSSSSCPLSVAVTDKASSVRTLYSSGKQNKSATTSLYSPEILPYQDVNESETEASATLKEDRNFDQKKRKQFDWHQQEHDCDEKRPRPESAETSSFAEKRLRTETESAETSSFAQKWLRTESAETSSFSAETSSFAEKRLRTETESAEPSSFAENRLKTETESAETSSFAEKRLRTETESAETSSFAKKRLRTETESVETSSFAEKRLRTETESAETSSLLSLSGFNASVRYPPEVSAELHPMPTKASVSQCIIISSPQHEDDSSNSSCVSQTQQTLTSSPQGSRADNQTPSVSDQSSRDGFISSSWSADDSSGQSNNNSCRQSKVAVSSLTGKSDAESLSPHTRQESSQSPGAGCLDFAERKRKRKREKLQAAIVTELANLNKEIRTALSKENPNISKAVAALEDVEDLPVNESILKKCPSVVETVSKCRRYKDSEEICHISKDIYAKFQRLMNCSENKRPRHQAS